MARFFMFLTLGNWLVIAGCATELKVYNKVTKKNETIRHLIVPQNLVEDPEVANQALTCGKLINEAYMTMHANRVGNVLFKIQEVAYAGGATICFGIAANKAGVTSSTMTSTPGAGGGMTTTMSMDSSTDSTVVNLRIAAAVLSALLGAASTFDAWFNFSQRGADQQRIAIGRLVHLENASTYLACASSAEKLEQARQEAQAETRTSTGGDAQKKTVLDALEHLSTGPLTPDEASKVKEAKTALSNNAQKAVTEAFEAKAVTCADGVDKTAAGYRIAARTELSACTGTLLTPFGPIPNSSVSGNP